mgnify:FL=1
MKLDLIIPTNLNEIPLKSYQKFIEVCNNSTDEEFISHKMVELFCGIELKEVIKIKQNDLNRLVNHFTELFKQKPIFEPRFKINDKEFGFIPNLEKITTGEYIDLDKYITDLSTLNNALAVMYRPITKQVFKTYEIEEYQGSATYSEVMEFCPLGIALASQVFFYNLGNELLKAIPHYLSKEIMKMNTHSKHNLEKDGDGIIQSINSLREMLQNLMNVQSWDYINHLPTLLTKSKKQK